MVLRAIIAENVHSLTTVRATPQTVLREWHKLVRRHRDSLTRSIRARAQHECGTENTSARRGCSEGWLRE